MWRVSTVAASSHRCPLTQSSSKVRDDACTNEATSHSSHDDYRARRQTRLHGFTALRSRCGPFPVGWFSETLPAFLARPNVVGRPAALVHVDSDLYSSAVTVLTELSSAGAIVPGTVLVFDELLHYPGWEANEFRALWEWLGEPDANVTAATPGIVPAYPKEDGAGKGSSTPGGVEFDVRWVCVKDRVLPLSETRKEGSLTKGWRQLAAEGYDQSVAGVVTERQLPGGAEGDG